MLKKLVLNSEIWWVNSLEDLRYYILTLLFQFVSFPELFLT